MKVKDPSFKPFCLTCVEYEAAAGARCKLWVTTVGSGWIGSSSDGKRGLWCSGADGLGGNHDEGGPVRCAATGMF